MSILPPDKSHSDGQDEQLLRNFLPDEHSWSSDEEDLDLEFRESAKEQAAQVRRRQCLLLRACGVCLFLAVVVTVMLGVFLVPGVMEASLKTASLDLGVVNLTSPTHTSVALSCDATMALKDAPMVGATIRSPLLDFLVRNQEDNGWVTVGKLRLPRIEGRAGQRRFHLAVRNARLNVERLDGWTFFTRAVVNEAEVKWRVEGSVDVVVGLFVYRGITLAVESSSAGMAGFTSPFPFIETYDAFSASLDEYPTQVAGVKLYNPSQFQILPLGQVVMDMRYKGSSMGWTATASNVSISVGWNFITLLGPLQPANATKAGILMSRFYGGQSSDVIMHASNYSGDQQIGGKAGADGTTTNLPACSEPLYSAALQGFDIPTKLKYADGKVNLTTEAVWQTRTNVLPLRNGTVLPLWAGVLNPFSSHMFVTDMVASVLYRPPGGASAKREKDRNGAAATGDDDAVAVGGGGVEQQQHEGWGVAGFEPPPGTGKVPEGAVEVAFVDEHDLWVPVPPNAASLTGTNTSDALDATIIITADTEPVLQTMLELLASTGVVEIALSGSFGIRIGALQLQFTYWQTQNVPCCDLYYARTHNASTSACNNPPTDMIKGNDLLSWGPSLTPTPMPTPLPI